METSNILITIEKKASGIEKVKLEEYYENGFKRKQIHLRTGKKDGKWSYYYENGKKRLEGLYKNGLKDGVLDWLV